MLSAALIAILYAHFQAYKEHYVKVFGTFAITVVMNKMIRGVNKDHSDMIKLGGYALTALAVVQLLQKIQSNTRSFNGKDSEQDKIVGGLIGDGLDKLKELFNK